MKRIQETEYMRVVMELHSALSRVAFLEERYENSVPVELYDAKVAEYDALRMEKAAIREQCEEKLSRKDAEYKLKLDEKEASAPATRPEAEGCAGDAKVKTRGRPWRKTIKCRDIREIFDVDLSEMPPGSKVALRLEPAVQLLARLFAAERLISGMKDLTENRRVHERDDMCPPIVEALFGFMQRIKDAGSGEYGTLALNAAHYLLDDKEGFSAFLTYGLMEISNNAIDRCFRHLALGRRNWLQCGSHKAAEHTAFMYSLVESCRMNGIDFGDYIEHVLRELMDGNEDYRSLLPNNIVLPQKETDTKAA